MVRARRSEIKQAKARLLGQRDESSLDLSVAFLVCNIAAASRCPRVPSGCQPRREQGDAVPAAPAGSSQPLPASDALSYYDSYLDEIVRGARPSQPFHPYSPPRIASAWGRVDTMPEWIPNALGLELPPMPAFSWVHTVVPAAPVAVPAVPAVPRLPLSGLEPVPAPFAAAPYPASTLDQQDALPRWEDLPTQRDGARSPRERSRTPRASNEGLRQQQ